MGAPDVICVFLPLPLVLAPPQVEQRPYKLISPWVQSVLTVWQPEATQQQHHQDTLPSDNPAKEPYNCVFIMAPTTAKKKEEKPASDTKPSKTAPAGRFDPYVGSKSVIGLERHNFEEFLKDKDTALVMFYDPAEPECDWSKKHFIRAAKTTERPNHAYAAIDCVREGDICKDEDAEAPHPVFKLYSRGHLIDTYRNNRSFLYPIMKKYVENAPLIIDPGRPKRPCDT